MNGKKKLGKKVKKAATRAASRALRGFARTEDATPEALKKPKRQWSVSASIPLGNRSKKRQLKKIKKWQQKG